MSQVQLSCLLTKKTETSELKGVVHYEHNPPIIARVTMQRIHFALRHWAAKVFPAKKIHSFG